MLTTYENIRIAPYKILYLEELRIHHQLNQHSTLFLTAVLESSEADNPVYSTGKGSPVIVNADNADGGLIFQGTVEDVKVTHAGGVFRLILNGISNTIELDIKRKDRSFQDKSMPYQTLINGITTEYPGGAVIDTASNGKNTGKFIMQYHETDWDFIKRLASHFNACLAPNAKTDKPQYFFGLPQRTPRGKLDEFEYSISKRITDFRRSKDNENKSLNEIDRVFFEITTDAIFDLGDQIQYQGKSLYICEAFIQIKEAVVWNRYILSTKNGCSQDTIYNERIIGLSIQGDVLETKTDLLKLHLCIDQSQDKSIAHFFKYSTMYTASGNSGFYCMPEIGDVVFAYFPSNKEWEGITFNGIRANDNSGDKLSDPDTKYLRTKYGKELKFDPNEILITAVDDETFIKINKDSGIEIFSVKPIKIHTKENLSVNADKCIYMTAKDEINVTCKTSLIQMDGNTLIQGLEVRHN